MHVLGGTLCRGCPRNCKRRVFGRHDHWDLRNPGKVAEGSDPRARTSATSNESRANALGGVSWRKRKSPAVTRLLPRANGSARNSQNRGDGLRFRRWGVACCLSSCSGRIGDRVPSFRCLLISTSAAVAFLATGPGRAQTAAPPAQVAQNQRELPPVKIEAPRAKPQTRAKRPGGRLSTTAAISSPGVGPSNGEALAGVAPTTPLNTNVIAASATRLGLTIFQTPASVEVVSQRTMQEQGYRTTTDTALGAVGVLSGDSAGAPANFSMRGFSGPASQCPLQRHFDRPGGYHVALDGDRQSRPGRIPQRPVVADVRTRMRSAARSITSAGSRPRDRSAMSSTFRWIHSARR